MNGYGPPMGGYFMPVDRRELARDIRQNIEGLWSWTPEMEGVSERLKWVEQHGCPLSAYGSEQLNVTVRDPVTGYEIPMDEWFAMMQRRGSRAPWELIDYG